MILVDTSIWVDHLRRPFPAMTELLLNNSVNIHPLVIGELACGYLPDRDEILALLRKLPAATTVEHDEAMRFVHEFRLMNKGVGWIDIHLLASAALSSVRVWTFDRRMRLAAAQLDLLQSDLPSHS